MVNLSRVQHWPWKKHWYQTFLLIDYEKNGKISIFLASENSNVELKKKIERINSLPPSSGNFVLFCFRILFLFFSLKLILMIAIVSIVKMKQWLQSSIAQFYWPKIIIEMESFEFVSLFEKSFEKNSFRCFLCCSLQMFI